VSAGSGEDPKTVHCLKGGAQQAQLNDHSYFARQAAEG
jgi:hypothetical protein